MSLYCKCLENSAGADVLCTQHDVDSQQDPGVWAEGNMGWGTGDGVGSDGWAVEVGDAGRASASGKSAVSPK